MKAPLDSALGHQRIVDVGPGARPKRRFGGFSAFALTWLGQVISSLGSGLTGFALGVWVYGQTGSVTKLALISLSTSLPGILLLPIAGALVDRWDRRRIMICSDAGAAVCTLVIVVLLWFDRLEIWHICLSMGCASVFRGIQWPAFVASMTMLVPKRHLGRANGMNQLGEAVGQIIAPLLGGFAIAGIGLAGIILVDVGTFLFAASMLLFVNIPQPVSAAPLRHRWLWREIGEGWTYLRARPALLVLLSMFAGTNFTVGMLQVLITPLVLSFASVQVLGRVLSLAGSGLMTGGLIMSIWGGPRRRMTAIYSFLLIQSLILLLAGFAANAALIATAAFVFLFCTPFVAGCSQVIWQAKVTPHLQGRVFSLRRLIAASCLPLAYLVGGPLADGVFEPLLAPGGGLAGSVGQIVGVGQGRGIALMFILLGVLTFILLAIGYFYSPLRDIEEGP